MGVCICHESKFQLLTSGFIGANTLESRGLIAGTDLSSDATESFAVFAREVCPPRDCVVALNFSSHRALKVLTC